MRVYLGKLLQDMTNIKFNNKQPNLNNNTLNMDTFE